MSLYRFKIGEGALIKLFYTTTDLTQYVPTQVTPRIPISITGYGTSTVPQDGDLVVDDYGTFAVVTGEVTVSDNVPQAYVKIISHVAQGVYKISNQALNATVGGTYSIDDANISPSSRLVQKGDIAVDENGRVGVFQYDYDGTGINVITTIYAAGVYQKPSGGIPKTDLAQAVQNSLDKAESALQSVTKNDVGLGNVDNVKQYSASNPPPYPVTSVNGKMGAVNLSAADVGAATVAQANSVSMAPNTGTNGARVNISVPASNGFIEGSAIPYNGWLVFNCHTTATQYLSIRCVGSSGTEEYYQLGYTITQGAGYPIFFYPVKAGQRLKLAYNIAEVLSIWLVPGQQIS